MCPFSSICVCAHVSVFWCVGVNAGGGGGGGVGGGGGEGRGGWEYFGHPSALGYFATVSAGAHTHTHTHTHTHAQSHTHAEHCARQAVH